MSTDMRRCLFCGSPDELRACACGSPVFMNLNDIDYAFFVSCAACGRGASVTGWLPNENHDLCVKLWNDRGWDGPTEADRATFGLGYIRMIGPQPDVSESQWRGDKPIPPPPTLGERLIAFKASKRTAVQSNA
jgi:hypothetical protein